MRYKISFSNPSTQYIQIECQQVDVQADELIFCLPAWRPGRYELGNFAKNIKDLSFLDENGQKLCFDKLTKDSWKVFCQGRRIVTAKYLFYANILNAGSTWLDDTQIYVNPVNCLMYLKDGLDDVCDLKLNIPENWQVCTGMVEKEHHVFRVSSYHKLADSPFIASNNVQRNGLENRGVKFEFCFVGECKINWHKVKEDLNKIISHQLDMMGEFPTDRYKFLFQILPYSMYHGVEHLTSTVIALGPSYELMKPELYNEFLGISSHELFHVWNVKTIRPAEMMPYDYSRENYSRLGYVTEGVTTYYGDLICFRCGVFDEAEFNRNMNKFLNQYFHNYGRQSLSVADSSFDTWLDGYQPGVPHRKVSIYNEGAICAWMCDMIIRLNSKGEHSLDDVMREMNQKFGKTGIGYTKADYKALLEKYSGVKFDDFFNHYIDGTKDYTELLVALLSEFGLEIGVRESEIVSEKDFGFKTYINEGKTYVQIIAPGAPAESAGLMINDEVRAVNGMRIEGNLNEWLAYFDDEMIELTISTTAFIKKVKIFRTSKKFYKRYFLIKNSNATTAKKSMYESWSKNPF